MASTPRRVCILHRNARGEENRWSLCVEVVLSEIRDPLTVKCDQLKQNESPGDPAVCLSVAFSARPTDEYE